MKKHTANKKGLAFENVIIEKLWEYKNENRCYGIKIPTEFIVNRVAGKVVGCFPKSKSFLDFIVFMPNGKVAVIEAKSTANKTSFGLDYIKSHQYDMAKEISNYCNEVYYIILFRELDRLFLVKASKVEDFRNREDRKSIPLSWFENHSYELNIDTLDFLSVIEKNVL